MDTGKFIVFEGVDGSGTSSQGDLLAQSLRDIGLKVHRTAEPSKGEIGLLIRKALKHEWAANSSTLALLFAADRLDHLAKEVIPALESGSWVICDRYVLSSFAYQSDDLQFVGDINSKIRTPDMTLFLSTPAKVAMERIALRGNPKELFERSEVLEAVRERYLAMLNAKDSPLGPSRIIDGNQDIARVAQDILWEIRRAFLI